jgi:2-polyprenyl-6-methoxyphenol hydroxylase-like FAD-dependent oxidoreductase
VTTFLHSGFHMVAYPVSRGTAFNLVAFTRGERIAESWSGHADPVILASAMRGTAPALARLVEVAAPWMAWPIHTVEQRRWTTREGAALIGDAAHAMTPFAAQGAAMAIEDAATLAGFVAASPADPIAALAAWEAARRPRVAQVARRGAVNRLAWHAAGPVAMARNLFLKLRPSEKLAADLDWLYGWRAARTT